MTNFTELSKRGVKFSSWLKKAVDQHNQRRRGRQAALWKHVTPSAGWFVQVIGPDCDGEVAPEQMGRVFQITQTWLSNPELFSAKNFYMYTPAGLQIVDCPAEFKPLL